MQQIRSSVDQWRVLAAVVDQGGFAQAAAYLHRSQSAVSYAMAQLQSALGVQLLEMRGRRAGLTVAGEQLLRRARTIVDQFQQLEVQASTLDAGWETELRMVVDAAYPQQHLVHVLDELRSSCPHSAVTLAEAVLSGAEEAITGRGADVVVTARVPAGFLGDWLLDITMVAVAAPAHPLLEMGHALSLNELALHTQVVVRDSGQQRPRDEGWLGAQQRWIVANPEASRSLCVGGLAYAWLPSHMVAQDIAGGRLKALPLAVGGTRRLSLYAVLPQGETAGPAARRALELLRRQGPVDVALPVPPAAQ